MIEVLRDFRQFPDRRIAPADDLQVEDGDYQAGHRATNHTQPTPLAPRVRHSQSRPPATPVKAAAPVHRIDDSRPEDRYPQVNGHASQNCQTPLVA
ncbi:hypothetical protein LWC34_51875 [Kibdelosporangium philippinense]|uniref:Uncharacterized protein n=1 Tax=Kibdelosporangium philippinense TaxID=211113 RepID=A0ABS8ZU39_9PSEU|nr:hypothetical protein [Kibdelosporangium philippinense]MCE7011254.1 hypothetical protein [Kibdelosporangium philippinense]